jgi:hypothetical protein
MTHELARALLIIEAAPAQFRRGFAGWLAANWPVFEAFQREALNVTRFKGFDHYSAHRIIEYLRHDTVLRSGDDFKINEAWTSSMARLFAHLNPTHADLFEYRVRADAVVASFKPCIEQYAEDLI